MKVVQTEPQSPFDALWRLFRLLKNATCVGRMSWSDHNDDGGVVRTFRLPDGKYVQVTSTKKGNELGSVPAEEVEIYEDVWKQLGSRALGEPANQPHGIMFASYQFFELTEERLLDF